MNYADQLQMQMLLNCHLAAFLEFEYTVQKQPNDNLITLVPMCNCSL